MARRKWPQCSHARIRRRRSDGSTGDPARAATPRRRARTMRRGATMTGDSALRRPHRSMRQTIWSPRGHAVRPVGGSEAHARNRLNAWSPPTATRHRTRRSPGHEVAIGRRVPMTRSRRLILPSATRRPARSDGDSAWSGSSDRRANRTRCSVTRRCSPPGSRPRRVRGSMRWPTQLRSRTRRAMSDATRIFEWRRG